VKLSYCGAARLEGNNISVNYDGVNSQGSPPTLTGNALWANTNDAFHCDGGSAVFEGNTVTGAGAAGIHVLNGARVTAGNSTFSNYQWGISAETASSVLLVNGDFSNGFKEAFKCDSTATLDWLVDGPSSIDGNDATLRGNLTIMSGGKLALSNMKMQVWSSAAMERTVELRSGGELLLETVNFTAYDPAFNHKFTSAGKLEALNSSIEEVGRDQGGNGENAGLFINGGSAYLFNSQLYGNYIGAVIRGSSLLMEQSLIANPQVGALDAVSSIFESRNGTVEQGSAYSLKLDQSSRAEMKVTTFSGNAVQLLDGPSVVNVYWYLRVKAQWAGGDPLDGASVRLSSQQGQPVWTRTTDAAGLTVWEEVQEYSQRSAAKTSYTPHTINVTTGAFSAEKQVTVDRSLEYTFTFTDATAPSLAITSPADQSFLSTQTVELRGTASDPDSGIRKVEVSWNNATWYNATTSDGWATWNYTFNLIAASHTLHARATNGAGNRTRASVSVTIEVSAPFLVVDYPKEGALVNQTPIRLDGMTSTDATVSAAVNGVSAPNATQSNGRISGTLDLVEGPNLIEIRVADRAGNFNSTTRNVTLDTIPPWIVLERPFVSYTALQSVDINGTTDGEQVTINGMLANLSGGRFTRTVILNYGAGTTNTTIEVVARDAAGNLNRSVIYVLRDLTAPAIRLSGAVKDPTNQTSVYINGSTEPDAVLTIQGVVVALDGGGNFSYLFELQEGVNVINIVSTDIAGNIGKRVLTIHRDTIAPALSVISPLDGAHTYDTLIDVVGATEPGAVLTVNGEPVNIGLDGCFTKTSFMLDLGQNNITVIAVDSAGNYARVVLRVTRDESIPPPPPPPVNEPVKGELETLLPWIFILLIIVGGAGAGAWAVLGGRKQKAPPPRRPSGGRPMSPVEAQAARRTQAPARPRTAQELYGADYEKKFSRPAAPAAQAPSPWGDLPEPAQTQPVSWGAEEAAGPAQAPVEEYVPPPPAAPGDTWIASGSIDESGFERSTGVDTGGGAPPSAGSLPHRPGTVPSPGEAPAHPAAATKAVDSDIDDLLRKIGEASKKK
jgi:uncharacterized protein YfaP (DUF2135 family)